MKDIVILHIPPVIQFFGFDPGAWEPPKYVLNVIICNIGAFPGSRGQNQINNDSSYGRNCNIFHLRLVRSKKNPEFIEEIEFS